MRLFLQESQYLQQDKRWIYTYFLLRFVFPTQFFQDISWLTSQNLVYQGMDDFLCYISSELTKKLRELRSYLNQMNGIPFSQDLLQLGF